MDASCVNNRLPARRFVGRHAFISSRSSGAYFLPPPLAGAWNYSPAEDPTWKYQRLKFLTTVLEIAPGSQIRPLAFLNQSALRGCREHLYAGRELVGAAPEFILRGLAAKY